MDLLHGLQSLPFPTLVREDGLLFPWIESVHVLAITAVVGTIFIVDFRLVGLASRGRKINEMVEEITPYTWGAFFVAVCTGAVLFSSNAVKYAGNAPFLIKMVLLVLAGLNVAAFNLLVYRDSEQWAHLPSPPWKTRIAGGLSVVLWVSVIGFGRWIGFTMH
jgi:hypothetical protein